ncbi:centrosomal protein of 112 kDa isoform X2 [Oryzias latipes]|nr:centrosomal protein of 112 kDa isoform X2 [Oryzias latipes]
MNTHEDSAERLDTEFDHILLDMKPYVLKHPNRTERQRCAVWIKKLCDPASCGSGLTSLRNRNLYARLLLHMLKRGLLEGPFTSKPGPGTLKTLPAYMSIYFGEPLAGQSVGTNSRELPDWVTGELGASADNSLVMDLLKDKYSSTPVKTHHRRRLYEEMNLSRPMSPNPLLGGPRQDTRMMDEALKADESPEDSDLEAHLNSWNTGTDVQIKVLEAKHQEEKLKLQQRHDADIEKILDRKHAEIEEMKSLYQAKQKESQELIRKLEKKVQSVLRESQVICQSKDKQIEELKKMSDQSSDSLRNEWEKKLHAAVSEVEQEKFLLQKKHTQSIQELLDDTNARLAKMEKEYNTRSQTTEQKVFELELRVKQQSVEVEKCNTLRQKVAKEKAQLEIHVASLSTELQEANRRIMALQKEKEQQSEQHDEFILKLEAKHETDISHLHQEHDLSAAKSAEVIEDFEKIVAQMKHQLQDTEYRRLQQVRDQEMKFQQEKTELQVNCEKKVSAIQAEAEKEKMEANRKIAKLEESLREMESQLDRARESQRQQIQQADRAMEQFKKQVELSSEKVYTEMKLQMKKVEEDLVHSKSLRENQAKEFSQQLDALREKYEQQMAEQRSQHEQERTRLQQQHKAEKDTMVQEHQREVSGVESQARAALQQHQQHSQEWRKRDAQTISELEALVEGLREELQDVRRNHKQQLTELASLHEEERRRAVLDKETSLDQLRSDMERIRSDLERSHQQEKNATLEKTNSRMKQIEKEYSQKLTKSAQLIAELQTSVCDSKEEALRTKQAMEKQLKEANARWDEERRRITHHADQTNKMLQEKLESLQRQLHSTEKKLLSKELETEEKVTMVHQEYEGKIKGLMPAEVRQELEDTITSLKAQVSFLQKTASLLQEELNACRSRR